MKKFYGLFLALTLIAPQAFGADSKVQDLSATTAPLSTDVFYVVVDPSGTPLDRQVTGANLGKALTLVGKITITQPATGSTFTLVDGKTLTVNKTLTLEGTDGTTMTFPSTSATLARTDAANTFTGVQTMTSANLITPTIGVATATSVTSAATSNAFGHTFNSGATVESYACRNTNGTGGCYFHISKQGGGNWYFGSESTGGAALITGSAANAGVIGGGNDFPLQLATNDTIRATFLGNGNLIVGTASVTDGGQKLQVAGTASSYAPVTKGTVFSVATCGDTPVGAATAGTFMSTTTGVCAAVVTMGNSVASPAGWSCTVNNQTTANLIRQTASSTTTATFSGTTVDNDVISFNCTGY